MQYSLLSRFQGCLGGLVLGESFACYRMSLNPTTQTNWLESAFLSHLRTQSNCNPQNDRLLSHATLQVLELILQAQTWNPSVAQRFNRAALQNFSSEMMAIVALPITLLFHDDLNLQRQALWQLLDVAQVSEEAGYAGVMYAYVIAQAVKGQLNPRLLVDQIQAYLRVTVPESSQVRADLLNQLEHIQQLQTSETDLSTALDVLQTSATYSSIAIAIYCFLQTPHSFQLSLLQTVQVKNNYASTSALTAALSGTYNGIAGLPASWRSAELAASKGSLTSRIHRTTTQLLALWSGIYDASNITEVDPLAVAAPWVIRLR